MSEASFESPPSYTFDDLPRFSPWPARLLGLEPWSERVRSRDDLVREFEGEKWGPLFERLRAAGAEGTLDDVERWSIEGVPDGLTCYRERFTVRTAGESREFYTQLVEGYLAAYLPAPALVELGCGYGGVLLRIAGAWRGRGTRVLAGDSMPSAVETVRLLAGRAGLTVEAETFDFYAAADSRLAIPPDSVIFTSYAMMYLNPVPAECLLALASYRPRAVVHFEPCYGHYDLGTVLGLLRRRYVEVNGYNRDLLAAIHGLRKAGAAEILLEEANLFGLNPLLPASVCVWRPCS